MQPPVRYAAPDTPATPPSQESPRAQQPRRAVPTDDDLGSEDFNATRMMAAIWDVPLTGYEAPLFGLTTPDGQYIPPWRINPDGTPQLITAPALTTSQAAVTDEVDEIDEADRRNLGRNSALMAAGTLVSRVLGMVNGSLQTAVLGTLVVGDAFKAANTFPNFILVLLSGGILNAVLIPQITKAMKRPDGGQDFVNRLVTATLVLILGVAVLATAGGGWLMSAFTSLRGPGLELAIAFAYLCLPQVLFYGIFAVLGNILQARGSFAAYGWAPVMNNVVAIAGEVTFLVLWGQQEQVEAWTPQMVWVLAGSATLGIVVQALILIPALYRTGFRYRPRWGLRGHGFGALGRYAALTFTALVIAQAGGLYTLKVATHLREIAPPDGPEIATYLSYQNALSLFQMPYSLVAVSLLTALFPQLARAWQRRDDAEVGLQDMRDLLRRGLTLPALGIIPLSAMFMALSTPAVRVVYPSISPEQGHQTGRLLFVMCASMMGYTIVTLQQQYCFATEQGGTNLWMQCLVTGIQVLFAFGAYLVPLEHGMTVVVAGMFVGNWGLALVFLLYARRQIGDYGLGEVIRLYVRLGLASAIAGAAAWGAARWVSSQGTLVTATTGWAWQVGGGVAGGVVFLVVLFILVKVLHITEMGGLLTPITRRLRRR
ncbi:integral membrane protein MviN [Propionibacterium sp. oral taxon 192 str. F0372]|uniref:murein biosynthesis integral membrane protein MurJ n=1 Tax=Propionibacterium sp. oral taxon 192 TaxID=671222 RepID=UPI000353AEBE|nr:murein biosynthesis integral membrane protein MurJ [Propionibacterium sp. oral taxon 192]EPH03208.1 integral membrane protein MviN [Propionibacterium sp. oral taxon 192 str. F0372]